MLAYACLPAHACLCMLACLPSLLGHAYSSAMLAYAIMHKHACGCMLAYARLLKDAAFLFVTCTHMRF